VPAIVTTRAGCSVRWTNTTGTEHTSVSDTGLWNSGDLIQNESFTRVFSSTGSFAYKCSRHPVTMQGTVVVN
jgi:plastocyanin